MTDYNLYLESGPRRRKTMVHVLDLLGCIAQGPTTDDALEATPEAIRAYLRFLKRHGEGVDPQALFSTWVAEHITQGNWLANGDPTPGFSPDFQPLSADDLALYLRRLEGLRAELLDAIRDLPAERLLAEPEMGRSPYRILEHVAGSQAVYLRGMVGKVEGLPEAVRAVEAGPEALPAALTRVWEITGAQMGALTEGQRAQRVDHGQVTWTARRAMRRMLEHAWEHLQELSRRLG